MRLSVFWHQMYRQTFSGAAEFCTDHILCIPPKTLMARYGRILAVFVISGLLHLGADFTMGIKLRDSGSLHFFTTQALGIILEDAVQAVCQYLQKTAGSSKVRLNRRITRIIGYIWLCLFLAWSTPAWSYPAIRNNRGAFEDELLPFSLMGFIRQWYLGERAAQLEL